MKIKILHDENGQLVIPRPRFEAPAVPSPQLQLVYPKPEQLKSPVAPTPHCLFYCRWCEGEILLAHASIGRAFGPPTTRRIEVRSIAAVCPTCSHVSGCSLFRGSHGFDTRNKLTNAAPCGNTTLVDWMPCTEATCPKRLPLFVHTNQVTTGEVFKQLARTWQWQDLECCAGHRITVPQWVFAPGSHRLPALI